MRLATIFLALTVASCATTDGLMQSEPDEVVDLGDRDPIAVADCVETRFLEAGHVLDRSVRAGDVAILSEDAPSWGMPNGTAWVLRFSPGKAELLGRDTLQGPMGREVMPAVRECAAAPEGE